MLNRTLILIGAMACLGATAPLARESMQTADGAERKPAAIAAIKPLPVLTGEVWAADAWPFLAEKATLSCRPLGAERRPAVFVSIDGENYGLNPVAISIAVTPRPILVPGAKTQAMIERGAALCAANAKPLDVRRAQPTGATPQPKRA